MRFWTWMRSLGHPDQMENGKTVGQAAHHPVDRGKLAHAVGRGENRRAANAGVSVGGIGGVEFVGANDPLETGNHLGSIVDRESIVPGNSKHFVDSKLGKACQNVFSNGGSFHRNGARMARRILDCQLDLATTIAGAGSTPLPRATGKPKTNRSTTCGRRARSSPAGRSDRRSGIL